MSAENHQHHQHSNNNNDNTENNNNCFLSTPAPVFPGGFRFTCDKFHHRQKFPTKCKVSRCKHSDLYLLWSNPNVYVYRLERRYHPLPQHGSRNNKSKSNRVGPPLLISLRTSRKVTRQVRLALFSMGAACHIPDSPLIYYPRPCDDRMIYPRHNILSSRDVVWLWWYHGD